MRLMMLRTTGLAGLAGLAGLVRLVGEESARAGLTGEAAVA